MITEKIRQKFREIDPPVLFLFDGAREYEEELFAEEISDFKIIKVQDNFFRVKYEVEFRGEGEKILLYHTFDEPKKNDYKNYPLTDLLLAGSVLAVDELAEILDSFSIPVQVRSDLNLLKKWIKPKKNINRLLPALSQKPFDLQTLQTYVLSIVLDEKKTGNATYNLIRIFEILNEGQTTWEKKQKQILDSGLGDALKDHFQNVLHLEAEDISYAALQNVFQQLKYNIITSYISEPKPNDPYSQLKIKNEIAKIKIINFVKDWQDDKNKSKNFDEIFLHLGSRIDEQKIYETYGSAQEYGLKTKNTIALELYDALTKVLVEPSEIIEKYAAVHNLSEEYTGHEHQIDFLLNTARFFELRNRFSDFIFNRVEDYIERYGREIYKIDQYYRDAFTAYQSSAEEMDIEYQKVFDKMNAAYDDFLIALNNPWVKSLDEIGFDYKQINAKKQFDFYKDFVAPISTKKVVIISDAFRYELAMELMQELKTESENEIKCEAILASVPSYTNLGMSNLLPNNGIDAITTTDSIDYTINGIKTLHGNREAILKNADSASAVIDYSVISKFNAEEGRNFFKDKQTVYIYHNWMDSIGDKKASEYYTFESVAQCITQLKMLMRKIYNSFNIRNILVTADHGFLFNYKDISIATIQKFPDVKSRLKEHTRFCITEDTSKPEDCYSFPLAATTNISADANIVLPKAINRFRKQGNFGKQFVHGGASLQEVMVPVLQFYRNRNNQAVAVNFTRIDSVSTVSTSMFKLKFVQAEPVGTDYKQRTIVIKILDTDNQLISNEAEVTLDFTSAIASERTFEVKMDLTSRGSKLKVGYIKVFDKGDDLNPLLSDLLKINLLEEIDDFS